MSRASPLRPELRRAAIIAATEKLIAAQGGNVSTRAIAEAAGIAEGTIFRVFPTKEHIIHAVFEDAFDQDAYRAQLAAIDPAGKLRSRMIDIVGIVHRRIRRIMALFTALGFGQAPSMHGRKKSGADRDRNFADIAAVLEPDRDHLRVEPVEAARLLQAIVMAQSIPMLGGTPDGAAAPEQIVDLVLNGIARHPAASKEGPAC